MAISGKCWFLLKVHCDSAEFLRGIPLFCGRPSGEKTVETQVSRRLERAKQPALQRVKCNGPQGDALVPRATLEKLIDFRAVSAHDRFASAPDNHRPAGAYNSGNTRPNSRFGRDPSRLRLRTCAGEKFHGQQNADRRLPPGGNAGGGHPRKPD
ncbi:MAG: hypothetical protein WAT78_09515 [Rhizobiaceae bacterium]